MLLLRSQKALLTAKAHGGVMEGFLVLLPSKAETFGLDISVVVGLVTCSAGYGWKVFPPRPMR